MASSMDTIFSFALEVIEPLGTELAMFALAALTYMLFTGATFFPGVGRTAQLKIVKEHQPRKVISHPLGPKKESTPPQKNGFCKEEDLAAVYQPIVQACKAGSLEVAWTALDALSANDVMNMPIQVPVKVLLALSKTPKLPEEFVGRLLDISSSTSPGSRKLVEAKVFETASAEASRWRNAAVCRQLYDIAGLASIQRSERSLMLLVRGHSSDPLALKSFVEDLTSSGSGVQLTKTLLDAIMAQCLSANDVNTAKQIKDQYELRLASSDLSRQAKFISTFGKERNLDGALETFQRLKDSGLHLNTMLYNCLIDACVECKDIDRALNFFFEMKEQSLADTVSYNTLMKGHLAIGDIEAAKKLLRDMLQNGIETSTISYHALLNAVVSKGDRRETWRLVDEMLDTGLRPNGITCSILLKGITEPSNSSDVARVLSFLDKHQQPMDEVLFASLAEACGKSNCLDLLWKRTQLLAQQGITISISAPTYGSMIKAVGQAHETKHIWALWNQMERQKVKPTAITLGCMVEALVMNNQVNEAHDLVCKAWKDPDQRSLINTVIYSTIVKGFSMSKEMDKVAQLYKEMKDRCIPCNTITYNTILNAMARCGQMDEAAEILRDMRDASPPVIPDIVTYSTIVKGYCLSGDIDKSFAILEDMKKNAGLKPDEVMFNSLLDGCAKRQRLDDALKLFDEMRSDGVAPSNYTLSILCKLLGRARRVDQAFAMVDSITKEYKFRANIQVYTCLMQACASNRQLPRALALHDKVVEDGFCTPDEKTYSVLARCCLQASAIEKALHVVRCAFHLPGHSLKTTRGKHQGVELSIVQELISKLDVGSSSAKELIADLKQHHHIEIKPSHCIGHQGRRPARH